MKRTLPVIGMACASCSAHVERTLNGLRGVQSASVSLASRTAPVSYTHLDVYKRQDNVYSHKVQS